MFNADEFIRFFIGIMSLCLRLSWQLVVFSIKLIYNASILIINGLRGVDWRLPSSKILVLAPGDSAPPADKHQDYMDYRGVAKKEELMLLECGTVSLGYYVKPHGQRDGALWLVADILQSHCAVIGPPGAGKTEGIIIPWILQLLKEGYSVVTVDVKGDLIDQLGTEASRLGCQVWYWNSNDPRSQAWNWLDEVQDSRDIEAAVQSILGRKKQNDTQPFFYDRDYRWLRTLINIVKSVYGFHAKPRDIYLLVGNQEKILELFRLYPQIRSYANEISELFTFTSDEYSRAISGLLNALHLFNDSSVVRVSEHSDFHLSDICNKPTLLIVGASLADAQKAEVLSSIMLNQLFNYVYRRFGGAGASLPLYFLLDESPRLKERINFEEVLSVVRSAKVGVCLAAQNVTQFGDERQSSAILNNCSTIIVLQGCSAETFRYFSSRLGTRQERMVSINRQRGAFDVFPNHGVNEQTVTVPVLNEREIMHPPQGKYCAVIQVRSVSPKPFLIDLKRKNTSSKVVVRYLPPSSKFKLHISSHFIPLDIGTCLREGIIPGLIPQSADKLIAEVSSNPIDPTILGLRNLSNTHWTAILASGQRKQIDPGKSIKLVAGTKIEFGLIDGEIS